MQKTLDSGREVNCGCKVWGIYERDKVNKERPLNSQFVHSCKNGEIYQERGGLIRYFNGLIYEIHAEVPAEADKSGVSGDRIDDSSTLRRELGLDEREDSKGERNLDEGSETDWGD